MFYFQTMFQQVYNGITGSAVLPAVQQIAEAILLLAALFAVYEAYAKGGDARTLALAGVRYLIMGLLITQYPNVFRNVNNAFANVAQAIAPTDVWTNFRDQVQGYMSANNGQGAWWNWVVGGVAGAFSLIFQAIAVLVFPISYAIFSFFYSMYGAVLYVVGPLVLALYPALGVGQLARTFMVNLMVWNAWGHHLRDHQPVVDDHERKQPEQHLHVPKFWRSVSGGEPNAAHLAVEHPAFHHDPADPVYRKAGSIWGHRKHHVDRSWRCRCCRTDRNCGMGRNAGRSSQCWRWRRRRWWRWWRRQFLTRMVGQIIRLRHRLTEIMQRWVVRLQASGHAPQPPGGGAMVDANSAGGSGAAAAASDEQAPNDSSRQSHGRPGHFGHYNIPHAVGWTVGTWAGATRRTVSSAFKSSQSDQQEEG